MCPYSANDFSLAGESTWGIKCRIGQCGNCFTLPEVNCSLKLKDIKLSRSLNTCRGENDGVALTFMWWYLAVWFHIAQLPSSLFTRHSLARDSVGQKSYVVVWLCVRAFRRGCVNARRQVTRVNNKFCTCGVPRIELASYHNKTNSLVRQKHKNVMWIIVFLMVEPCILRLIVYYQQSWLIFYCFRQFKLNKINIRCICW
jgi:hypothetical protein